MKCVENDGESSVQKPEKLEVSHLGFAYPGGTDIYEDITFRHSRDRSSVLPGQLHPANRHLARRFCVNILIREASVLLVMS